MVIMRGFIKTVGGDFALSDGARTETLRAFEVVLKALSDYLLLVSQLLLDEFVLFGLLLFVGLLLNSAGFK
jgi:hypothetical protein